MQHNQPNNIQYPKPNPNVSRRSNDRTGFYSPKGFFTDSSLVAHSLCVNTLASTQKGDRETWTTTSCGFCDLAFSPHALPHLIASPSSSSVVVFGRCGSPNRIRRICMRSVHFPTVSYLFIEEVSAFSLSVPFSLILDRELGDLSLAQSHWDLRDRHAKKPCSIAHMDEKRFPRPQQHRRRHQHSRKDRSTIETDECSGHTRD